ncbi:MAG: nucleotidyltransferase family protein [Planctomycetaceae bacterium]|nr:nucleotidyltransferase family protein [Planctomycetaceae bacterium]
MVTIRHTGDALWERIERAVEKVKDRLRRVTSALERADIPYAVVGGNAVQVWVAQVDEAAVRNTRDVDILINRSDLERIIDTLGKEGFMYRHAAGVSMFLDGPEAKDRDAVHVVFASEKVRPEYVLPTPDLSESELIKDTRTLRLEALVRMELTAFRLENRVHVRDMLDVGLIDETWLDRFPAELRVRLQELIDTPDG